MRGQSWRRKQGRYTLMLCGERRVAWMLFIAGEITGLRVGVVVEAVMATSAAEYEASTWKTTVAQRSTWKTTASVAQRSTWTSKAPRAGVEGSR
ncbi:hypothetical protein GUJ93_ZPchr0013g37850 [Zizania palustris]|uniref:Uncharacterized protein n=1 Tax=Zizania palustris TaxID=103762 RepID=A0A8J6C3E6_ZIZPA|nr:hypothetical protein GUJ93_ZPchr0013g37850 [Zizania palustris]